MPELSATQFIYKDPLSIPKRPWLYGFHLIRKNVSVTVAPGGVGKSSLTIVQALELASGKSLLGHRLEAPANVWIFNLEDERTELERRVSATMQHYGLTAADIGNRLFVDTGREQELVLARQLRDEARLDLALIKRLSSQIRERGIDLLILDPFVSAHHVNEMDNGKIDLVVKALIRVAEQCNCAIELVHHTRKLNGVEASSDSSRGASALINAARSARVLQRLSDGELKEANVYGDGSTYFSVKRDKSNLAQAGTRETYRTVSVDLGQGDTVGVVETWKKPSPFEGLKASDLLAVQKQVDQGNYRASDQTGDDWVGNAVAHALSLDMVCEKKRIKRLLETWFESKSLKKEYRKHNGKDVPFVIVGEWATV